MHFRHIYYEVRPNRIIWHKIRYISMETGAFIVNNGGLMLNLVIDGFEITTGKLNPMVKDWRQIYRFFI